MAAKRIIPCLDVKDARVVKGINFKGLRDMGHPAEMGVRYGLEGRRRAGVPGHRRLRGGPHHPRSLGARKWPAP